MNFGTGSWRLPYVVQPVVVDFRSYSPPAPLLPANGAAWSDITIYPMNGETVGIAIKNEKPRHFHAVEVGMAHKVTRNPTVSFELLLHLCAHHGRTDWRQARFSEDAPIAFDNFPAFKMQTYALRRALQRIFGVSTNPFSQFGVRKDLVTAFRALPMPPGEMRYVPKPLSA